MLRIFKVALKFRNLRFRVDNVINDTSFQSDDYSPFERLDSRTDSYTGCDILLVTSVTLCSVEKGSLSV